MKDMLGTEVKDGDIIAIGMRSGNVGALALRVVIDADRRKVKGRFGGIGTLGEWNNNFIKLETSQLQNKLGYEMLDVYSNHLDKA